MGPTHVFRSGYGRALTVATAVAAVAGGVGVVATDGARGLLVLGPWLVLAVVLVAAAFWLPQVEVSDAGVEVRNVWSTVRVPWPAFRGVEAGFSLEVRSVSGTVGAWAAPRSSGTAARLARGRGGQAPVAGGTVGTGATGDPGAELRHRGTAEAAARAVADRYTALRDAGHLEGADAAVAAGVVPTRRVHVRTVAAVALLTAAGVAGLLLG